MEIDKTQILFVNLLAQVCVQQQQQQQQSECQLLKQITHNWHFFQLLQAGIVRPVASNESRLDAAAAAAVTGKLANWQLANWQLAAGMSRLRHARAIKLSAAMI